MADYRLDYTLKLAVENFAKRDPREMAQLSGACYENNQFRLSFLNQEYLVEYPTGHVSAGEGESVSIKWQILFLHYLCHSQGLPSPNEFISYKELPDGMVYIDPFTRRAIQPMVKLFAHRLIEFRSVAESMGGVFQSLGDISVSIPVLPKVAITLVMWSSDDEFPASGNILFDATAAAYLPTEDYAILASELIWFIQRKMDKC